MRVLLVHQQLPDIEITGLRPTELAQLPALGKVEFEGIIYNILEKTLVIQPFCKYDGVMSYIKLKYT